MTTQSVALEDERLARIRYWREAAEAQLQRSRRRDSTAILVGLGATTSATLLAGVPAATTQFLVDGWQLTCAITAVLTATATLATGLRQQFGSHDRLIRNASLASRLRRLEFGVAAGRMDPAEADDELAALIEEYPEMPASVPAAGARLAVA